MFSLNISGWYNNIRIVYYKFHVVFGYKFEMHCVSDILATTIEKIVNEYDQEIPQSQTADNPVARRGRAAQPLRDTRKTNQAKQPAPPSPPRWLQYQNGHKATYNKTQTEPRSAVGNVSGYRCMSDCRSRGREFDPGPVPYFRVDWSWNYFYGHSSPFRWFIQEGLLSVTSESMCTSYWWTACSSLPRKKCG